MKNTVERRKWILGKGRSIKITNDADHVYVVNFKPGEVGVDCSGLTELNREGITALITFLQQAL